MESKQRNYFSFSNIFFGLIILFLLGTNPSKQDFYEDMKLKISKTINSESELSSIIVNKVFDNLFDYEKVIKSNNFFIFTVFTIRVSKLSGNESDDIQYLGIGNSYFEIDDLRKKIKDNFFNW